MHTQATISGKLFFSSAIALAFSGLCTPGAVAQQATEMPNVVVILSDDQGWGETSYAGHPTLQTPNIDDLAASGLVFERFYASAPNCSPTRAALLTGRNNDRTGVIDHGYRLRPQEITLAEVLLDSGYVTGHFGKWHLSGVRGPGVPILADDPHGPETSGFETWLSVTNYFDDDPVLSRNGTFLNLEGDSSQAITAEAIAFMKEADAAGQPFFASLWFGSPHTPWDSAHADHPVARNVSDPLDRHHGEIVGIDLSVGMVRDYLRQAGLSRSTIVWFQSDNGAPRVSGPGANGGLRGYKNTLYEGGIRVPSAIEWPGVIEPGRTTDVPAASVDVLPTILASMGQSTADWSMPLDGENLLPLLQGTDFNRAGPLFFRHRGRLAAIDGDTKVVIPVPGAEHEVYDLGTDPAETTDLSPDSSAGEALLDSLMTWNASVDQSLAGLDYSDTPLEPPVTEPASIAETEAYRALTQAFQMPAPATEVSVRAALKERDMLALIAGIAFVSVLIGAVLGRVAFARR